MKLNRSLAADLLKEISAFKSEQDIIDYLLNKLNNLGDLRFSHSAYENKEVEQISLGKNSKSLGYLNINGNWEKAAPELKESIYEAAELLPLLADKIITDDKLRRENKELKAELDAKDQKLKFNEERYQQLFNSTNAIILLIDPETGIIEDANDSALSFYGYSREEMKGMTINDLSTLDDSEVNSNMKEALLNQRNYFDVKHELKNGELRDVEVYSGPVFTRNKDHIYSIIHDVTKRKEAQKLNEFRLEFEELITEISTSFINLSWKEIDEGINKALARVGNFLKVDRCYVYKIDKNRRLYNPYEWCNEGIDYLKGKYDNIFAGGFQWSRQFLASDKVLEITSLSDFPEEAELEREVFKERGIKSLLAVPMLHNHQFEGFVGFESVKTERSWCNESVKIIKLLAGIIVNAIKQKENQMALNASEKKYKKLVDTIKEVVLQVDTKGRYTFLNNAWEEITGFSVEESLGKNFYDFIDPDDIKDHGEKFLKLLSGEIDYVELEFSINHKNGEQIWLKLYASPEKDMEGYIVGVSGTLVDITETVESKNKLEENLNFLSTIVDAIPAPLYFKNKDYTYVGCNQAFCDFTGRSKEELIGNNIFDIVDKELADYNHHFDERIMLDGGTQSFESKVSLDGKGQRDVIYYKQAYYNIRGSVDGFVGVILDITDRKEYEREIRRLKQAVDTSPAGILLADLDGVVTYANPGLYEIGSYQYEEEILGRKIFDFTTSYYLDILNNEILPTVFGGGKWQGEIKVYNGIGDLIDVEITCSSVPDSNGNPQNLLVILSDITARVETENALIRSESEYRAIFNNAHDAILLFRADDRETILACNDSASELYGYTKDELIGKSLNELSKDSEYGKEKIAETLKNGTIKNLETKQYKKNGEEIILEVNGAVVEYNEEKVILSIQRDITDRKKTEEALRESEERYRGILESQTDLIVRANLNNEFTYVNDAYCKKFNKKREELIGKSFIPLIHPDDRENTAKEMEKLFEHPYRIYVEQRAYTRDGWRWIAWEDTVIRDKQGNIVEIQGVGRDITSKKYAEEALRESEERFRELAENVNDVFFIRTREKMLYASPAFEKIWGISVNELYANPEVFMNSIHPDDKQKFIQYYFNWDQFFSKVLSIEYRIVRPDKDIKWVNVRTYPIKNKDNSKNEYDKERFVGIVEDITEKKNAEKDILTALDKEKELNDLKSKFISMVSHEFRTPMATILSSLELIEHYSAKWPPEKSKVHFNRIKGSIDNMVGMLNDVTEINRADSGRIEVDPKNMEVVEFTKSIIEEIKNIEREYPEIKLDSTQSIINECLDEKLMRLIILNLVSNAVKYTPNEKSIDVKLDISNDQLIIKVKDEGIGIPEKDKENIFEPFTRSSNTGKIKGTGLGLSIVNRAVNLHNGTINFSSRENEGTEFIVKIPIYHKN